VVGHPVYDSSQPSIGTSSGPLPDRVPPPISPVASQADMNVSGRGSLINSGLGDPIHHNGEHQGGHLSNGTSGTQESETVRGHQATPPSPAEESPIAVGVPLDTRQVSNLSEKPSNPTSPTPIDYPSSPYTLHEPHPTEPASGADGHEDDVHASPTAHETGHNYEESPDKVSFITSRLVSSSL
jgi:hypothetical protein